MPYISFELHDIDRGKLFYLEREFTRYIYLVNALEQPPI